MKPTRASSDDADRGQTLPDFTVAIAIFLATVAFIVLFVPQIIQPFDNQEQSLVAERLTSDLTNSKLIETGTSSQLNESSTMAFFNKSDEAVLREAGIEGIYSVNITIRDAPSQGTDSEILCAEDGTVGVDCKTASDPVTLAIGQSRPAEDQSVATTRRTLFAGDRSVVLEVGVWSND